MLRLTFSFCSVNAGFGTSALEASAAGLPVIASIYGLTDAVAENETGLLVELAITEDYETQC